MGNFKKDLKVGEIGEKVVIEYLYKSGMDVTDVRDEKMFQKYDIDFIASKGGKHVTIEVKSDTMAHRTKNIAYEVYSSYTYKTKGCFEKTKAKFIFYYLVETEELYKIHVKRLRKHVDEFYRGSRLIGMGDDAKGYLIKIRELVAHGVMERVL